MADAPSTTSSQSGAAQRWRSIPSDAMLRSEWDGEVAVYHRLSGKTHFLNASGALLLDPILTEPRNVETAARELAARTDREAVDQEFIHQVASIMVRLAQIGLIEPE